MKVVVIVLLVGCLVAQVDHAFADKNARLPKQFTLCKPGDDVCLLGAITSALKLMRAGMPEIGVVPVDPLHVKDMDLTKGMKASFNLTFKNMDLFGMSNAELQSAKGEFGDNSYWLEISGTFPSFIMYGDYAINGNLSIYPVRGSGKENFTYTDLDFTATLTGHVIQKEGVDYVIIDDATFDYLPNQLYIHFGNLFDGNQELGDNMNKFVNANWKKLLYEVHPAMERDFGKMLKAVASRVYQKVPYRNIHPKE